MPDFPKIIQDNAFSFGWDEQQVWALDVPVSTLPLGALEWHFDLPFWNHAGQPYSVSARQIMDHPEEFPEHALRIRQADTSFPIDVALNPKTKRWTILDGLHRLVKLAQQGQTAIPVRCIPLDQVLKK